LVGGNRVVGLGRRQEGFAQLIDVVRRQAQR
jgi:hypothetical protein